MPARAVTMKIVELHPFDDGVFSDGAVKFIWTSAQHASMQGMLEMERAAKTVRTVYPGGNNVSEQAISSAWQPFDISGEWDDKWAGQDFAWTMHTEMSRFAAKIPMVRFTLDEHSIVAMLTNYRFRYRTKGKIFYTLTLSPHDNETDRDIVMGGEQPISKPMAQWHKDLTVEKNRLADARARANQIQLKTNVLDTFDTLLTDVNTAIDRVGEIASNGIDNDAERRLRLLASTFRRVRASGLILASNLAQQRSDINVATDDVIGTIAHDEWLYTSYYALIRALGGTVSAENDVAVRIGKRTMAIYKARKGESLERISQKFYGTPNNAELIYSVNRLTSWILVGGEELVIPAVSS